MTANPVFTIDKAQKLKSIESSKIQICLPVMKRFLVDTQERLNNYTINQTIEAKLRTTNRTIFKHQTDFLFILTIGNLQQIASWTRKGYKVTRQACNEARQRTKLYNGF